MRYSMGMNNSNTYEIRTLCPLPSMNEEIKTFTGSYADAVAECHRMHRMTGRRSSVVSQMVYWHTVSNGIASDKNTGSGVASGPIID